MAQYGFYVDTTRCIKCWACVVACKQWNEIPAGTVARRKVDEETEGTFPDVKREFLSTSCMHCENPLCVEQCPQSAISKRDEDGVVVVDRELCIGCKTCSEACPFDVPEYLDIEGVGLRMDKCDTCLVTGRDDEERPHCVVTCPMEALHFGPLEEMGSKASEKNGERMEGSTNPSVYIA